MLRCIVYDAKATKCDGPLSMRCCRRVRFKLERAAFCQSRRGVQTRFTGDATTCEYYQLRRFCFRVTLPNCSLLVCIRLGIRASIPGPFIFAVHLQTTNQYPYTDGICSGLPNRLHGTRDTLPNCLSRAHFERRPYTFCGCRFSRKAYWPTGWTRWHRSACSRPAVWVVFPSWKDSTLICGQAFGIAVYFRGTKANIGRDFAGWLKTLFSIEHD
jgi:hypothetical protein